MKQQIILASGSPRRQELLKQIVSDFKVVPADIEELIDTSLPIEKAIEKLSLEKAQTVAIKHPEATIVAGDPIVYLDGEVLGKPTDRDHARAMLQRLSGRSHQVITGVTVMNLGGRTISFSTAVEVHFKKLRDKDIETYLDTDEPYDKAGAYAIQGRGRNFIDFYDGDYTTAMGLPVKKLREVLKG